MKYAILDINEHGFATMVARKLDGKTWIVRDTINARSWIAKYENVLASALCFQHSAPQTAHRAPLTERIHNLLMA